MPNSRRIKARVFLEGYEVPTTRVSINVQRGVPVSAQFDLVPLKEIKHMEPRTAVHIFTEDPYEVLRTSKTEMDGRKLFNWFLAFEGEFHAKSYGKSTTQRSFTAHCTDLSNYWDNAKAFFYDATFAGNVGEQASVNTGEGYEIRDLGAGARANINIQTPLGSVSWLAAQIKSSLDKGGDFGDAVRALYSKMGAGNQFLRLAETRYRIADKVVSLGAGESLKNLLNNQTLFAVANASFGKGNGGMSSLRQVLQTVLQFIFYDISFCAYPSKIDSDLTDPLIVRNEKKTIASFIIKPNLYFCPPPKCNVIFPSMYTSFGHSHDYFSEATRVIYRPSITSFSPDTGAVTQDYVYFPENFSNFMKKKPNEAKQEPSDFEVGNLFGDRYQAAIARGGVGSDDTGDPKITSEVYPAKLRINDYLSQEEQIRGIVRMDLNSFPGVDNLRNTLKEEAYRGYFNLIAEYLFYKQRFEHRKFNVTLSYNPHLVVGFPILLLDESDADQNVIGYLESIQHQLTPFGISTSITVSYAREIFELKNGQYFEPPVPPWFDPELWGSFDREKSNAEAEAAFKNGEIDKDERDARVQAGENVFTNIDGTYKGILGIGSITSSGKISRTSTAGAARRLLFEYKKLKDKPNPEESEKQFISQYIRRPLVTMKESFNFIDANHAFGTDFDELIRFVSSKKGSRGIARWDGTFRDSVDKEADKKKIFGDDYSYLDDSKAIDRKRNIIKKYVDELKSGRGKRG